MTTSQILIVDHQTEFIEFCHTWLEPEGFTMQPALNGLEAIELIQTGLFELVLVDLALPDIDSLNVLRALDEQGLGIPVIISSDQETIPVQRVAAAMELGATSLIEKPVQPESLVETVQRALVQQSTGGVWGSLHDLSLTSLITVNCNEGRTAALEIQNNGHRVLIFFEKGQIVHAQLNEESGEEAIFQALSWDDGHFMLLPGRTAPEQTIHTNWSGLLLEGLRRIDEAAFDQETLLPEETSAPEPWPEEFDDASLVPAERPGQSFDFDPETQTEVENRLDQLYQTLGARCILFASRSGRLLHMSGNIDQGPALSLAALIAGSFSATSETAELLARPDDKSRQFRQSLQEGADFSLYSTQVDLAWILAVAFDPNHTNLGLARQMTLQAATELETKLNQARTDKKQQEDVAISLNQAFRQEVSDALGALFD